MNYRMSKSTRKFLETQARAIRHDEGNGPTLNLSNTIPSMPKSKKSGGNVRLKNCTPNDPSDLETKKYDGVLNFRTIAMAYFAKSRHAHNSLNGYSFSNAGPFS